METNREKKIRKFGIEIVEYDEDVWLKRGYKINYDTNLLEQLTTKKMENKTCSQCKNLIPHLTEFPSKKGGIICQDCYEKEFETLTKKEKIPNFKNKKLVNI